MEFPMTRDRTDVYTRITAEIVAAIEAGAGEFKMPWHHNGTSTARPANIASGKGYRGVNVLALWVAAEGARYDSGLWGTYRQWQALEAQVRKGEHGTTVVLWKEATPASDDDHAGDEDSPARRIFARAFTIFNVAQVDGYQPEPAALLPETERVAHAEAFIGNLGIKTVLGSPNAYYRPATDTVHMPDFGHFHEAAGFYGSWIHECGHASGAKHRLDRDLSGRFGSAAYALEEIGVELLSGMILADLGIAHHPRPDHAAYVASWLRVLKDDSRAIFTAASKAQQAADWMHARQPQPRAQAA
jgi:antirestriction protein ArdC